VSLRELFLENFAGDLEYHPKRAALYLVLGVAAGCFWVYSAPERKMSVTALVFLLGGLALILKGVFLFRPSSEGIGLTYQDSERIRGAGASKELQRLPTQAAQILQDFGAGGFLLWPLLNFGEQIDHAWNNPPRFYVFISGAALFGIGWLIRRLTSSSVERSGQPHE
jgi:hypothetical protein